jgi:hypothetical protein
MKMNSNPDASRAASRAPADLAIAFAAFILVVAAACNPGGGPSPTAAVAPLLTTGVRGVVLAGPTCPVEQAGQSPCVRSVSGATIIALDSTRHEVGRVSSDVSGAYFLRLPPGNYEIVAQPIEGLMGVAAETAVTVLDGAPLQLDLQYDTGIR